MKHCECCLRHKAYVKARNQTPEYKAYQRAYQRAYRQIPKHKAYQKAYHKAYQKAYYKAHRGKEIKS